MYVLSCWQIYMSHVHIGRTILHFPMLAFHYTVHTLKKCFTSKQCGVFRKMSVFMPLIWIWEVLLSDTSLRWKLSVFMPLIWIWEVLLSDTSFRWYISFRDYLPFWIYLLWTFRRYLKTRPPKTSFVLEMTLDLEPLELHQYRLYDQADALCLCFHVVQNFELELSWPFVFIGVANCSAKKQPLVGPKDGKWPFIEASIQILTSSTMGK